MNKLNKRKSKDLQRGEYCEKLFLSEFKNYVKRSAYLSDAIDFKHKRKKKNAELKSRDYNFNDCKDWKVGLNKINDARRFFLDGGTTLIYMMFYDGLYFWKFHPDKINQKQISRDSRVDRGKIETGDYYNIKLGEFTKSNRQLCNPLDLTNFKNVSECMID